MKRDWVNDLLEMGKQPLLPDEPPADHRTMAEICISRHLYRSNWERAMLRTMSKRDELTRHQWGKLQTIYSRGRPR